MPIQHYYPNIFIKSQRQIICGLNFYESDVTYLANLSEHQAETFVKSRFEQEIHPFDVNGLDLSTKVPRPIQLRVFLPQKMYDVQPP